MRRATKIYQVDLTRKGDLGELRVDMEAFIEFSFWITRELAELVEKSETRQDFRSSCS